MLVPGQSTTEEVTDEPRSIVLVDRLSPRMVLTTAMIVGGASLIAGRLGGLYWLMGVHICALLTGLLNAWVFLLASGAGQADWSPMVERAARSHCSGSQDAWMM
jgi:hypothetical protein